MPGRNAADDGVGGNGVGDEVGSDAVGGDAVAVDVEDRCHASCDGSVLRLACIGRRDRSQDTQCTCTGCHERYLDIRHTSHQDAHLRERAVFVTEDMMGVISSQVD